MTHQLYWISYLAAIQHVLVRPTVPLRHGIPCYYLLLRLFRIDIPDYPSNLRLSTLTPLEQLLPEYLTLHYLMYGETEVTPDRLQLLGFNLLVFLYVLLFFDSRARLLGSVDRREEGALQGVRVEHAHLSEDNHARCRLFGGFVRERAVWEGKKLVALTHEVGDQTD